MFESYRHPWFILYSFVIAGSIYSVLWLGGIAFLIGYVSISMVELKRWPHSIEWCTVPGFNLLNRFALGGYYLIITLTYFIIGSTNWVLHFLVIAIVLFLLERKLINHLKLRN